MDVLEVRVPVATVWTAPDAPRDADAPAIADLPDLDAWTGSMDARVRKELDGRTLTQLLIGEAVQVVETRGDWARIVGLAQPSSRHPVGYPGWVRQAHVGEPVPDTGGSHVVVTCPRTTCRLEGGPDVDVSFGTRLRVVSEAEDSVDVLLPGDQKGRLSASDVRRAAEQPTYSADDLLSSARQFLGLRYLWGGTSGWGMDCSGLTHLTFRAQGTVIPRDAFDQAAYVEPVALDEVQPGDLYFFARPGQRVYHVGLVSRPLAEDGSRWMLHAPESGELIEDAPLAPHREQTLVSAGRVPGASARR
jgi:hypothetical protein